MHDQINYINTTTIQSPAQFVEALKKVQAQITEIKQEKLTTTQARNLEVVEVQIIEVTEEAQKPQPALERIQTTLGEAKETMDMLAGGLASAAALGTTIGGLILLVARLFGG